MEHPRSSTQSRFIQVQPLGYYVGAALGSFRLDTSLDGIDYTPVLTGSFAPQEMGQTKSFAIQPSLGTYVRLTSNSNQSAGAVEAYVNLSEIALLGTRYCVGDSFEPDSTRSVARWTNAQNSIENHNFSYPDDVDWYRIQPDAGKEYKVRASTANASQKIQMDIYDPGGALLLSTPLQSAHNVTWYAPATQEYFIKLYRPAAAICGANAAYTFSISSLTHAAYLPVLRR